jgi:type IV secretory pathway ATPase VirB11/archaellum biosynthesis ATPase
LINGKQCTILWHVDNIKLSRKDKNGVTSVLSQIDYTYGKEAPLTVTRGKIRNYLGMTIDFSNKAKVRFTMIDNIQEMLDKQPNNMEVGEAVTVAAEHLFTADEDGTKLSNEDVTVFHHMTAKMLYLSKRARPDLQLAVAFICTRVKDPDTDDWKKLTERN